MKQDVIIQMESGTGAPDRAYVLCRRHDTRHCYIYVAITNN